VDDDGVRRLAALTRRERRAGDIDLWSLHWGGNWVADVPAAQRRFARALVDTAGAALVHGHSSHQPMPLEVHCGPLVLHGCGDLNNDYEGIEPGPAGRSARLRADLGCLYFATLDARGGGLLALDVIPLQRRRLRLQVASAEARAAAARQLGGAWREDGGALRMLNGPRRAAAEHDPVNAAKGLAGPPADHGSQCTTGETT
jgi:poly-gamma-glutamate synthesis protein (capsule biosynthesis protein)